MMPEIMKQDVKKTIDRLKTYQDKIAALSEKEKRNTKKEE